MAFTFLKADFRVRLHFKARTGHARSENTVVFFFLPNPVIPSNCQKESVGQIFAHKHRSGERLFAAFFDME